MNWLKLGYGVAPYLISIIISVALGILAFRRWIAPDLTAALEEATKVSTQLANLGGMKKQDWHDGQKLEEIITKELIMDKMPELQALQVILSPSSWEQIEEMIEENPAAVLKMYEKYAPLLGVTAQKQEQYMF